MVKVLHLDQDLRDVLEHLMQNLFAIKVIEEVSKHVLSYVYQLWVLLEKDYLVSPLLVHQFDLSVGLAEKEYD